MTETQAHKITGLLRAWSAGDKTALPKLIPLVEAELRGRARAYLHRERHGQPLQTTELINEVYLRLVNGKEVNWHDRAHFFAVAANIMRRYLTDLARQRKHAVPEVTFAELPDVATPPRPDLVALDDALTALAVFDPLKSRIVELRFFGGLTLEEIAEVLKLHPSKIKREWLAAKARLYRELSRQ